MVCIDPPIAHQTLGYRRNGKLVVLQPLRKARVVEIDAERQVGRSAEDAVLVREAISLNEAGSIVFENGHHTDEQRLAPGERGELHGSRHPD